MQHIRDYFYKNVKPLIRFTNNQILNTKPKPRIKTIDRLTSLRINNTISLANTLGSLAQETKVVTEHLKEKKIERKNTKMMINNLFHNNSPLNTLYMLGNQTKIIKKKIYKKFSLIFYISMPSIKINYDINNINKDNPFNLKIMQSFNIKYKHKNA